jgi:hypothetical protein
LGAGKVVGPCPCTTNWQTGEYHNTDCPEAKALRDKWCTPIKVAKRLDVVDLDPASNERSVIRAVKTYDLDARGEDGLALPWFGSFFLNGPYSNMLPFATKANDEWAAGNVDEGIFLVKLDPTTRWWKWLVRVPFPGRLTTVWMFHDRLQHIPPPRIKESTNNFASAIVHWRKHVGSSLKLGDIADPYHIVA